LNSKNDICLDACALLAFFKDEPGAEIVEDIIEKANKGKCSLYLHKVNFLEVYYKIKQKNSADAEDAYTEIINYPIFIVQDIDDALFMEAARLKVSYKISLADSFALGLASTRGMTLMTCDHHEFDNVEQHENIEFSWIR
jgi:PIN domain nuclease of toxin-antitoxin system